MLPTFWFSHLLVYSLCLLISSVQVLWGQGRCPSSILDIRIVLELRLVNERFLVFLLRLSVQPWNSCLNPLALWFLLFLPLLCHLGGPALILYPSNQLGFPSVFVFTLLTDLSWFSLYPTTVGPILTCHKSSRVYVCHHSRGHKAQPIDLSYS